MNFPFSPMNSSGIFLRQSISQPQLDLRQPRDTKALAAPLVPLTNAFPLVITQAPGVDGHNHNVGHSMLMNFEPNVYLALAVSSFGQLAPHNFPASKNSDSPHATNGNAMVLGSNSVDDMSGTGLTNTFYRPQIPLEFNPREAKNMPLAEKISGWLHRVPWFQIDDDVWVLDCYPGHASSNGCSEDLKSTQDDEDIFELQARQITHIITQNYMNNGEMPARPSTLENNHTHDAESEDAYSYSGIDEVYKLEH